MIPETPYCPSANEEVTSHSTALSDSRAQPGGSDMGYSSIRTGKLQTSATNSFINNIYQSRPKERPLFLVKKCLQRLNPLRAL
jgi:hypothetical protein